MNQEYLWNKTGADPEIEKLEKTLEIFRYREAAAAAPIVMPVQNNGWRWRNSLAFSFAALAFVAVAGALWLPVSNESNKGDEIVFIQPSPDTVDAHPIVEPKEPPVKNSDSPDKPAVIRPQTHGRTRAALSRREKKKDSAPRDNLASLTKEERYAYRQLMVALSISSSKLKIVQNTIDGTETEDTKDNASKNER